VHSAVSLDKLSVVVTTSAGASSSTVTLARFEPSFFPLDGKHVAGIIIRTGRKVRDPRVEEPSGGLGTGDVPLVATAGGAQTPSTVVISLQ
jgi:hypothetical protein